MAGRPNSSAAIAAHVQGLREAKAAFQALPDVARDRLLDATETTLSEIKRAARAHLQASPSIQTRNLYNAVDYTLNKNSGRGRVGIVNTTSTIQVGTRKIRVKGVIRAGAGGSASTAKGARLDRPGRRAHFVEFGTRKMRAEPFMTPAAESQKQPYLDRCQKAGQLTERDLAAIGGARL